MESPVADMGKRRSPIYSFFNILTDHESPEELLRMSCRLCLSKLNAKASVLEKHLKSFHIADYGEYLVTKANESNKRKAEICEQRKMAKLKKEVVGQKRSESQFSGKISSTRTSAGEIEDNSFGEGDSVNANDQCRSAIKLEQYELNPGNGHMEFIIVSGQPDRQTTSELSKEEKFIQSVYPQFNGKTKLQLIDQIVILQEKVKTYESTINRLINN